EVTGLGGRRGLHVRAVREVVGLLAGDVPLRGDQVGRDALGDELPLVACEELLAERVLTHRRGAHRDAGHVLHPARHDEVVRAGHDALRIEVDRLLRRAALTVDGRGGDGLRGGGRLARGAAGGYRLVTVVG